MTQQTTALILATELEEEATFDIHHEAKACMNKAAAELRRLAAENAALRAESMRFLEDALNEKAARKALESVRSQQQGEAVLDALNTLCKMLHSGEEVEGDDGLAMLVPMDLWNEAQEAIELLIGEDDAPNPAPAQQPLSDTQCDAIYRALDEWAKDIDSYDFGLPAVSGGGAEGARPVIRKAAHGIGGGE